jgi:DNA (cytosine-5)-methyltransferase 1
VYNKLSGSTPTVVTGGCPCQGFSLANKKQTDEDERNYLFQEFIRGVSILSPEFILLENVSAMKQAKDGDFVTAIVTALEKLGYTVEYGSKRIRVWSATRQK